MSTHKENKDTNSYCLVHFQPVLKSQNGLIELRADSKGNSHTDWSNKIVNDPETGVHGKERFPLTGSQR